MLKLKYGNTNTFYIRGKTGGLLVDTDYAGTLGAFYKTIKQYHLHIRDIDYMLATHYHPDHIGLISQLMKQSVKLLLIDLQLPYVHFSDAIFQKNHIPYSPIQEKDATIISISESRSFLQKLGINGEILSTPSHSADSITLILDNGECYVGDLEPESYIEGYDDNTRLKGDWNLIHNYNPKYIYYAHANETIL